jgi:hypothetical protein
MPTLPAFRPSRLDPVLDTAPFAGVLRCRPMGAGFDQSASLSRRACRARRGRGRDRPPSGPARARARRTLIATEETLLHPSRNPHLSREQIEDELKAFLGLEKVVWLWKGMAGDDAVRGAPAPPRQQRNAHSPSTKGL